MVAGFLTHSFMHLQLFHDAFDVTSWGCAQVSPRYRYHADINIFIYTPTYRKFIGRNLTTSSTFSAFPGSPSLLFVYIAPLGWLDNIQGQPLQPRTTPFISLHFPSSATATTLPLITLPRTYCRFCFLLLSLLRGRVAVKERKKRK